MRKKRLHRKWYWCGALTLLGLLALFVLQGYQASGLAFVGLAALIPMYHILGILKSRKPKLGRFLTMVLSALLCCLFLAMALTCGIILRSSAGTAEPNAQYLVVLGAKVHGSVPSRSLKERMDAACTYLTEHPDAVAIVSGGQGNGEDITEAECMREYLENKGIDPQRIWTEDKATNTLENLRFSLDIILEKTGQRPDKIAIVSSEYHLHRAGMFAGWLDIDADLIRAETDIAPLRWNYFLREIFAVWYYSFIGGQHNA